jgi:phosphatidate cytidylyltransferase
MTTDDRPPEDDDPLRASGRVRIIGAEPAGRPVEPAGSSAGAGDQGSAEPGDDPGTAGEPLTTSADLPHWTEAPTGEVPAVLARDTEDGEEGDGDPWSALPAPTWREEHSDWTAGEGSFEPSMLAQDETRLGSLDDSGQSDRQPWSFELPGHPADDDTAVVPAVGRPLSPEEPGEVAFRFDEVDGEATSPAAPKEVRGGTTAVPQVTHGPDRDDDEPAADAVPDGSPAGPPVVAAPPVPPVVAAPPVPPVGDLSEPGEDEEPASPGRRGRRPMHRRRPVAETEEDDAGRSKEGAGSAEEERPVPRAPDGIGGGRPAPPAPPPRRPPTVPAGPPPLRPPVLQPPESTRETRSGRDLPVAIATGLVFGVVALIFFKLGTVTSMIVVTVVVTLAAVEAFAAFRRAGYHPATLLGLVATVSLLVATYNKGQEAVPLVLILVFVFTMLWHLARVDRAAEPVRSTASTLLVFTWVAVLGSYAALLLNPNLFPDRHGIAFLLGALITGIAYDVGALAVGARMGRRPLSQVSPNKTWEGIAGGAVAAVLAGAIVVHFIHPWRLGPAVVLGLVVAVVSPIGDLSESMIKRHLGLKDMGRILPGHGGLLDRFDGLLFVVPATYYLVKAFNLG